MLSGLFQKRKKNQDLRSPSLQDIKKFRDTYAKHAEYRHVETPSCFEKSIYKAISSQKELHSVEFKQEDITDPQLIALAEALVEMPIVSSLDLRDNRITDDGAKALLEVLRLQIIAAKTPTKTDSLTKRPLHPVQPNYTRYVTNVNLKGNEVSAAVLQEFSQYMGILRREDKRLEIRAALQRIDRNSAGGIENDEFRGVLKLLTHSEPSKKEIRMFMQQHTLSNDNSQNEVNLENMLLAKCATSPSKKAACPPWEALVQERHANLGQSRFAMETVAGQTDTTAKVASHGALVSRASLPPSPAETAETSTSLFAHSNSAPGNISSVAMSPKGCPVVPIDKVAAFNEASRSPSPPISQPIPAPQQPQSVFTAPDSKIPMLQSNPPAAYPRPPSVPVLAVPSMTQPTQRMPASTTDNDTSKCSPVVRETPSPIASPASSPRYSDFSDGMSVMSSGFGGSISQRQMDDSDFAGMTELKISTPTASEVGISIHEPSRWKNERLPLEEEEMKSNGGNASARVEENSSNGDEADDEARSGGSSTVAPKSTLTSGCSSLNDSSGIKNVPGAPRRDTQEADTGERVVQSTCGSDISPVATLGRDERRSLSGSASTVPRCDDLSSLIYHGSEETSHSPVAGYSNFSVKTYDDTEVNVAHPEEDEAVEECVDSVVASVVKDGKERTIAKLVHTDFRGGLPLTDFPADIPFRNLLALILSDNGLPDLKLFKECRFPFVLVLDLSRNKLVKLDDDVLALFPRLEVLNLEFNHLKTVSGVMKTFKLRALNLSHNHVRTVNNVAHLEQLEVLQLADNCISTVHALRLLSLNKMLAHLNLDGNPVVETDERQKRKNIVHIRNLLPTLASLGSIPCAGLHSRDKMTRNNVPASRKSLFDSDFVPDFQSSWTSSVCDVLQHFQDAPSSHSSGRSQVDEGDWEERYDDSVTDRPRKVLSREQQRQKDEMRSRAIGFRSREKAIPSPPKVKTSVFAFGPPQPPLKKKKKKKRPSVPADPTVVQQQQRRSSELSAPKHPPVDKALFREQQRRKSRITFDANMSVAERLQLAQEKAQRRLRSIVGSAGEAKLTGTGRRTSTAPSRIGEGCEGTDETPTARSRSPSPQRPSPLKDAIVFRVDPMDNPLAKEGVYAFRIDPIPAETINTDDASVSSAKESGFLHSLAVTDFLNHAEEEFSTALTALNVLLSMSEKELSERKKLNEYRSSLEALDILNERESHDLYEKTRGQPGHEQEAKCAEAFAKLGVVKRCMRQLLEKLEVHAPGSGVIRAFCRFLRSNELRGIIVPILESQSIALESSGTAMSGSTGMAEEPVKADTMSGKVVCAPMVVEAEPQNPTDKGSTNTAHGLAALLVHSDPFPTSSVDDEADKEQDDEAPPQKQYEALSVASVAVADADRDELDLKEVDQDFDFLEPSESVFDDTTAEDSTHEGDQLAADVRGDNNDPFVSDFATTTDITMDIQMDDSFSELQSAAENEQNIGDSEQAENPTGVEHMEEELLCKEPTDTVQGQEECDEEKPPAEDALLADTLEEEASVLNVDDGDKDPSSDAEIEFNRQDDESWLETTSSLDLDLEATDTATLLGEPAINTLDGKPSGDLEELHQDGAGENDWDQAIAPQSPVEEETPTQEEVYEIVDNKGEEFVENDEEQEMEGVEEEQSSSEVIYEQEVTIDDTDAARDDQQEIEGGEDSDDEEAEMFGDWEKGFDPNSNHYFWFNHSTGESSWTPPEGWPYEIDDPFGGGEEAAAEQEVECAANEADELCEENANVQDCQQVDEDNTERQSDAGSASPQRSNGSEFEFDDNDLPGF